MAPKQSKLADASIGMAVDAGGNVAYDPSANVLALVEASVTRLNDLRALETKRLEDLQVAEARRIDEVGKLRAEYQEKLSLAESKRIDAIRAVDVAAVAIASERAAQQASVLANQVSQSAETLRALVASTAQTVAASLSAVSGQLIERISALEKSSYVGSGRQAVADPMLEKLAQDMKSLRENGERRTGSIIGSASMWGYVVGAIGVFLGLSGLVITMYNNLSK